MENDFRWILHIFAVSTREKDKNDLIYICPKYQIPKSNVNMLIGGAILLITVLS